jgi:hypothetical protein
MERRYGGADFPQSLTASSTNVQLFFAPTKANVSLEERFIELTIILALFLLIIA